MPKFSFQVTPAVKEERGWKVTAQAEVLYGNNPPDPPEEVVFDVNGELFERIETNPESGIARSVMILQPGGYIITAYRPRAGADDRNARRTRSFAIREEKEKKLTPDEKKTAALNAKVKRIGAEKDIKEAEGRLELLQSKRKLEVLGTDLRTGVLEVFFCRLGKDGKPEPGEICAIDGQRLAWTMKSGEDLVVASLDLRDRPRKIVFFLPDDREVKTEPVDVPAKPESAKEEKKSEKVSKTPLFQRLREAYQEERDKGKEPEVEVSEEAEISEPERSEIDFLDIDRVLSDSEPI